MKKLLLITLPLVIFACGPRQGSKTSGMSAEASAEYKETLEQVQMLEKKMMSISDASAKDIVAMSDEVGNLYYDYDPLGMSEDAKEACEKLKNRVLVLKRDASVVLSEAAKQIDNKVYSDDDLLMEKMEAYPVYLERGDILYYNIGLQKPGTIKIYNTDAKTLLKTISKTTKAVDSLVVENKGIYLVEINPDGTQYASVNITYRMPDHYHQAKNIVSEEVECGSGGFRVLSNKGIVMKSVFHEPRKFTLSSQFKSTFSNAAKSIALVAVQVPSGATEILYSLRISTSEQDRSSDGKFPENMNISYKKIRFLGLPLYESSRGSGLFSSLLDDNRPLREEDAYCNMYVFRSQSAAKQFQDGLKQASELPYDVDYSTLGTQSCNGRIPAKGSRTIYLAFENERVRYSNYIWIEALAATPTTEYHTTKYTAY